jgi:hypothetical protein
MNARRLTPSLYRRVKFLKRHSWTEREPAFCTVVVKERPICCRPAEMFGGLGAVLLSGARASRLQGVCLWAVRGRKAHAYLHTKIVKELAVQAGQTLLVDGANEAFVRRPSGHASSLWNYERPTTLGHIPNADRGIVMEKRVTSLEAANLKPAGSLASLIQNCKRSRARAVTPSLCWLGCKAATDSKFHKAQSSALLQMITNNLLSKQYAWRDD